jgi:glutamate-1-semialdehyde aminotransferase
VLLVAYLAGVRAIADRYGIVLMLDAVMAGFAGPVSGWLWTPSTSSPT